jgi:uncharacterized protein YndB with AHSA1/START domain
MTAELTTAEVRAAPPPVVKRIVVRMDPEGAFDLFTREMSRWWPLRTHSCAGDDAVTVQIEPHVGGQIIETARDGSRAPWGTVLAWEPPHRFAATWHPMSDPTQATRVDVSFSADSGGGCQVELVHSGWEARGVDADAWRARYDGGWVAVLDCYLQVTENK